MKIFSLLSVLLLSSCVSLQTNKLGSRGDSSSDEKTPKVEIPSVKIGNPSIENWCVGFKQAVDLSSLTLYGNLNSTWKKWNAFLRDANEKGWELILVDHQRNMNGYACFKRHAR